MSTNKVSFVDAERNCFLLSTQEVPSVDRRCLMDTYWTIIVPGGSGGLRMASIGNI